MADIGVAAEAFVGVVVAGDNGLESREPAGAVIVVTVVTTVVVAPVLGFVDVTEEVVVETEGRPEIKLGTPRFCEIPADKFVWYRTHGRLPLIHWLRDPWRNAVLASSAKARARTSTRVVLETLPLMTKR